jgi:hypothetical protein
MQALLMKFVTHFHNKNNYERILTAETSAIALAVFMAKCGTTGISTTCCCVALLWCTFKILKKHMSQ